MSRIRRPKAVIAAKSLTQSITPDGFSGSDSLITDSDFKKSEVRANQDLNRTIFKDYCQRECGLANTEFQPVHRLISLALYPQFRFLKVRDQNATSVPTRNSRSVFGETTGRDKSTKLPTAG